MTIDSNGWVPMGQSDWAEFARDCTSIALRYAENQQWAEYWARGAAQAARNALGRESESNLV